MEDLVKYFIENKEKTNLSVLLCLKRIYIDGKRAVDLPFLSREISQCWAEVRESINPSFLNATYHNSYIQRQAFLRQAGEEYFIAESFQKDFTALDWNALEEEVKNIQPLFKSLLDQLTNEGEVFIEKAFTILENHQTERNKKIAPALLEIFSYSLLKTHLNYFGADIVRWTRTNSNDGGVDMTCGHVSYSVTTALNNKKLESDAEKQVAGRLNFITLNNTTTADKIKEMEECNNLEIQVIGTDDLRRLKNGFSFRQVDQFILYLKQEMEKELR